MRGPAEDLDLRTVLPPSPAPTAPPNSSLGHRPRYHPPQIPKPHRGVTHPPHTSAHTVLKPRT